MMADRWFPSLKSESLHFEWPSRGTTAKQPYPRKAYGGMRQNPYAHEQAAILQEHLHRFFRGIDSVNATGRIAVSICKTP
jgi:hypothetical protein